MKQLIALAIAFAFLLTACANIPSAQERAQQANDLAAKHGWRAETINTGFFRLRAYYSPQKNADAVLTVYIEGDGFAWLTPSQPSQNPTPIDPVALRMAQAQPDGNVAYLGRPCQYMEEQEPNCTQRFWTTHRFAPQVITATNHAIDILKQEFSATRIVLVGYSGGATVAALAAENRHDIAGFISVAGNLDPHAWTDYHHLQPLEGSLNPSDWLLALSPLQQMYFAGEKDSVIPPSLIENFALRFPTANRPKVIIMPDYNHHCCWAENWQKLWKLARPAL